MSISSTQQENYRESIPSLTDRKMINFKVPPSIAQTYLKHSRTEGFGSLAGWIISVLNDRVRRAEEVTKKELKLRLVEEDADPSDDKLREGIRI